MFQRILLAIDDSPGSEMATAFAGALATRDGGSVHVFHVTEHLVSGWGTTWHKRDNAMELVTTTVEQLADVGVWADGSSSVAASRRVANRIAETALARGCDAIVLGSQRQRRFGRIFSRRVRERTTLLSLLPVLIAPSPLSRIPAGVSFHQVTEADVAQPLATPSSS